MFDNIYYYIYIAKYIIIVVFVLFILHCMLYYYKVDISELFQPSKQISNNTIVNEDENENEISNIALNSSDNNEMSNIIVESNDIIVDDNDEDNNVNKNNIEENIKELEHTLQELNLLEDNSNTNATTN